MVLQREVVNYSARAPAAALARQRQEMPLPCQRTRKQCCYRRELRSARPSQTYMPGKSGLVGQTGNLIDDDPFSTGIVSSSSPVGSKSDIEMNPVSPIKNFG